MRHILIIDDDAAIRDSVTFFLSCSGFSTATAAHGRDGLCRCDERKPDLVITDIVMPEMEGIETILALRRRYGEMPIIAISGGGDYIGATHYLQAARKLGATETLPKPFAGEVLLTAIGAALA